MAPYRTPYRDRLVVGLVVLVLLTLVKLLTGINFDPVPVRITGNAEERPGT